MAFKLRSLLMAAVKAGDDTICQRRRDSEWHGQIDFLYIFINPLVLDHFLSLNLMARQYCKKQCTQNYCVCSIFPIFYAGISIS